MLPRDSALFERVFTVREDLVRALAPPGIEGAEAVVRSVKNPAPNPAQSPQAHIVLNLSDDCSITAGKHLPATPAMQLTASPGQA